jgi:hypothetical protein
MTYRGMDDCSMDVSVQPDDHNLQSASGRDWIQLTLDNGVGSTVTIGMDENHVEALVLGLRSAIAEIQARAVGR